MDHNEAVSICKAIKKSCMWGHNGLGEVIVEKIAKCFPDTDWYGIYKANEQEAKYQEVGVIRTREEFDRFVNSRNDRWESRPHFSYSNPDELSIHGGKGEGLLKYVLGPLARELGQEHDPHNFEVFHLRAEKKVESDVPRTTALVKS